LCVLKLVPVAGSRSRQVAVETGKLMHRIPTAFGASAIAWSPVKLALAWAVDEINPATGRPPAEGVIRVMSA
jgi:hypothetical protein